MSIVYETIQDGVSDGWISDILMPMLDGELGCDNGGSSPVTVFDDLQEILAFRGAHRCKAKVVEDEDIGL